MNKKRYEILLRADSPVAHSAGTLGNVSVLMTETMRLTDGALVEIPIVTADTLRHGLREAGTRALLSAAEIDGEVLTEGAVRLLWNGGMMRESGSTVRLEEYRQLVNLLPHMALLGGALKNRIEAGQIQADNAVLVCEETAPILPQWVVDRCEPLSMAGEHREMVERYRHDALTSRQIRARLRPADRERIEQQLMTSESMKASPAEKERVKMGMMPHAFEAVVRGSYFYWSVVVTTYSDLEHDTWMTMLGAFLLDCQVGGKKGTGHGRVSAIEAKGLELARYEERIGEVVAIDSKIGAIFRAHVAGRKTDILDFLREVKA